VIARQRFILKDRSIRLLSQHLITNHCNPTPLIIAFLTDGNHAETRSSSLVTKPLGRFRSLVVVDTWSLRLRFSEFKGCATRQLRFHWAQLQRVDPHNTTEHQSSGYQFITQTLHASVQRVCCNQPREHAYSRTHAAQSGGQERRPPASQLTFIIESTIYK